MVLGLFGARSPLVADSDGYYCIGRGYLAYELRWTGPANAHELRIVRYSEAVGIVELTPLVLEDFQVHEMTCFEDSIEVEGWTIGYTIDLSGLDAPRATHRASRLEAGRDVTGEPMGNLGHWGRAGVADLRSDAVAGTFQLVLARAERSMDGGMERYTLTRLIRRAPKVGAERSEEAVILFEGIFFEPIH